MGNLDSATTNREARPHQVRSYEGMQSPAFNGHQYEAQYEDECCKALEWATKRLIDLRGIQQEVQCLISAFDH